MWNFAKRNVEGSMFDKEMGKKFQKAPYLENISLGTMTHFNMLMAWTLYEPATTTISAKPRKEGLKEVILYIYIEDIWGKNIYLNVLWNNGIF